MSPVIAFGLGTTELIVVLVLALLLFGTRLPKVARSLGQGIREFKGGLHDVGKEIDRSGDEPPRKQSGDEPPQKGS